jgi:stress-induced-phosphoprotein 1
LKNLEKKKKKAEALAYIKPELAEEHRLKGNEHFKKGKWPDALKEYEEAEKRDPKNIKVIGNKALCYLKLMEPMLSIKECDKCLKLDPKFVKAWERKGKCHSMMKEYDKASKAFAKGLEIDPEH